jgi:hypothetical protein
MKYEISTLVADSAGDIEIDEDEFKLIKNSKANLLESLYLEENLDFLLENYYEYELELLSIASRSMIFMEEYINPTHQKRNVVVRRIANLLSTCEMYFDQSCHHISNIYGKNSVIGDKLQQERSSQYDQKFGYRVMEALINYTKHRGVPFHSLIFSGQWLDIDSEEDSRLHYSAIPLIKVIELINDKKIKQIVLQEMLGNESKDGLDIRPLIRDYIEGIGKIHEKTRELIQPDINLWEDTINRTITKFQNEYQAANLDAIAIVALDDINHLVERNIINKNSILRRHSLESKNSIFVNLHKRYASNEIRKNGY